jgi:hypothetical protein
MTDPTDPHRRAQQARLNSGALDRRALQALHGAVWDTEELTRDFEVLGFLAPFVAVRRKRDGRLGSLAFQHQPRFYFGFQPHQP